MIKEIAPRDIILQPSERDSVRQFLSFEGLRNAIAKALYQVQVEADNVMRTTSFANPEGLEQAQRAQGSTRGALRLIDILIEIGDDSGDDTPE